MNEQPEAIIEFDMPVVEPPKRRPPVDPKKLARAPHEMIPCPGATQGDCDSATLLNKEHAGYVADYLERVDEAGRTSGQENNLGCALVWVRQRDAAREAFKRAEDKAKTAEETERAQKNLALLDRKATK